MTLPSSYHTRVQGPYDQHPTNHPAPVGDMNMALHDYMHRLQVQHDHAPDGTPVPPGHPAVQPVQRAATLHKHAHDSGDGETIFHCPFCGSGDVVGGQDGTVSCGFCKKAFTVQVQPKFKNMPQTVDGAPYNIPGMPGGGPDAGAGQEVPPPPDAAPVQDAPIDDADAGLPAPQTDDAGPPPSSDKPPWMRKSQSALLVTDQGVALPAHSVMRRMALLHADDPHAVLDDLRRDHR